MKFTSRVEFAPPATVTMADMKEGDIGVVQNGSFTGETLVRNHAGWFTVENNRFWDIEEYWGFNRGFALGIHVRLIQPGDTLTIKRTA